MARDIIDQLDIEISASDSNALSSIDNVIKKMGELSNAVGGLKKMPTVNAKLNKLAYSLRNLASVNSLGTLTKEIRDLVDAVSLLKGMPSVNKKIDSVAKTLGGITENNLIQEMKESVSKKIEAAQGSVNKTSEGGAEEVDKYSDSLTKLSKTANTASSAMSKLGSRIKRILLYRAISMVIRAISSALKEGVSNVYQFSKAIGSELSGNLDKVATTSLYFKNALGSAFGSLLASLQPVITAIVNGVVQIINAFNQLIAMFSGSSTWLKPKEAFKAWGDEAGSASKKLQNFTIGLDELNVLNKNENSGGSGTDVSSMFEEVPVDKANVLFTMFEKLKKVTQDWLKTLNLEPITKAFEHFFTSVKGYINALGNVFMVLYEKYILPIASILIETVLPPLVNMLGTIFDVLSNILNNLIAPLLEKLSTILMPIVELLGGLLGTVFSALDSSLQRISEALGPLFEMIMEFIDAYIIPAFETFIMPMLEGIIAFLSEELPLVIQVVTTIIVGAIETVTGLIKGIISVVTWVCDNFKSLMNSIGTFLSTTFVSIWNSAWRGLANIVASIWDGIARCIESVLNFIIDGINNIIDGINELADSVDFLDIIGNISHLSRISLPRIPTFESGGLINEGQMFIAREAGPELVGTIGNRSAVVNNEQIITGISDGVSVANEGVIDVLGAILQELQAKDLNVNIGDKDIGQAYDRYNNSRGVRVNKGTFADAY